MHHDLLAIALAMWFISTVRAEPSTSRSFFDRNGSFAGSAIRNSDGTTSFYDARGRFVGSSTRGR